MSTESAECKSAKIFYSAPSALDRVILRFLGRPWRLALFSFETGKQVRTFDVAPTVQIGWDTLLRWSADSQNLTFVDNRGGFENVWAQPIDGGPARQLTDFKDRDIFPSTGPEMEISLLRRA